MREVYNARVHGLAFGFLIGAWLFFDTRNAVSTILFFARHQRPSIGALRFLKFTAAVVAIGSLLEILIMLVK